MAFITDKQTLDDLNIFGKSGRNSVFSLFNRTHSRGGALLLEELFRYPLSDAAMINQRSATIRYFMEEEPGFPFVSEWFDSVEHYLGNRDNRSRLTIEENSLKRKLQKYIGTDVEYEMLHKGVLAAIGIINTVDEWLVRMADTLENNPDRQEFDRMKAIVRHPRFAWVKHEKGVKKLDYERMVEYDQCLRYDGYEDLRKLLDCIYCMDVYVSVAEIARKQNYTFGKALPGGKNILLMENIYHPLVPQAVPNTIRMGENEQVIFLTGANMAGKSTFMKTFGIVIFLAHMGFPLPASKVEFTVQNGMYTTINLPDNLSRGYSHFYAEVLRVKKVAQQVRRPENLVIIFDELFRGTNVKDAFEATVAVTEALAERKNCTFLISTHIIEAGEELSKRCDNIQFVYLPTVMQGNTPTYTYTLKPGISSDRHGMMIIRNEGILEMLNTRTNNN